MTNFLKNIDRNWSLFLDRDGVINRRPEGGYVKSRDEFEFLPGVREALAVFSKIFKRIIVVTNQQGVGKGLMTVDDLELVHDKMLTEIEQAGGRIDAVYYCTDLDEKPLNCRKPSPFMAQKALVEFPDIELEKCLMAGDTDSDLQFGHNSGMKTVYINTRGESVDCSLYDATFSSLAEFAQYCF
ncbi:MAG: HAD family hydrolase [Bacteroidales bacterium]|nr:HAD family hydrolase [Bacteroidales bacterium]